MAEPIETLTYASKEVQKCNPIAILKVITITPVVNNSTLAIFHGVWRG
jgi:hypothetical protein